MAAGDSPTDQELVDAANRGDEQALEALYERYRDWVVATAFRLTGDRETALDCLQETFLHFVTRFPGFELRAQLKTYLYAVVRSTAIDAGRRRQRERRLRLAIAHEPADVSPAAADPDERRAALATIVDALPVAQREVLLLRFADGLDLREIAEAVGIPLGTVKSRLHHALRALRADDFTRSYLDD